MEDEIDMRTRVSRDIVKGFRGCKGIDIQTGFQMHLLSLQQTIMYCRSWVLDTLSPKTSGTLKRNNEGKGNSIY